MALPLRAYSFRVFEPLCVVVARKIEERPSGESEICPQRGMAEPQRKWQTASLFSYQGRAELFHLKRLTSGEARLDVMPPFDLIAFVGFPAEKDYPAISHRRKINQTLMVIFQLDAKAFQLSRGC